MKRFLLASVATIALVGTASAADIYRKAPPPAPAPAPAPAFSWTGCFVGAHWGWGWGRADVDETFHVARTTADVQHPTPVTTHFTAAASDTIDTSGALFGGQVGCDYEFGIGKGFGGPGGWVIGIQGDIAGADINGFGTDPLATAFAPFLSPFARIGVKDDAIASVTGRLGFSAWQRTLLYVRGGVAWLHQRWDLHGTAFAVVGEPEVDETRTGWTIGVGAEWAFAPNWSAFVEWNHYDFGNNDLIARSATFGDCTGVTLNCFTVSDTLNEKQRIETVKIGVNYRFNLFGVGKGKAPVVARY